MKKILFIAMLIVGSASFSFAQVAPKTDEKQRPAKQEKSPEERATDGTNRMTKELGLTADQAAKIHAFALTRAQKMDDLKAKASTDNTANQAARKKIMDEFDTNVKTVLTPEQYTKWQAEKEEHKKEHKESKEAPEPAGK
ncbi:MAG: hypothetical protein NT084_15115 [Bacteroidetes bacterium]|jgi:Spy/CpxP family protein refolding chaperone|nr:hypothetical protein [Bacteroidota bacterium]